MCRRAMPACLAGALLALRFLSASAVLAQGIDCPNALLSIRQDDLYNHFGGELATPASTFDSTFSLGSGQAHLTFDHNLAQLSSSIASDGWFTATVRVVERFDIVGVAPGTPVNATLTYNVDGWSQNCGLMGCGVNYWASLVYGPDSVIANATQNNPGPNRTYLAGTLSMPVTFTAGTPISATFSLNYRSFRFSLGVQAQGSGHYAVSGLPAGVRAITCYGSDVTPVRNRTWGSIKASYR